MVTLRLPVSWEETSDIASALPPNTNSESGLPSLSSMRVNVWLWLSVASGDTAAQRTAQLTTCWADVACHTAQTRTCTTGKSWKKLPSIEIKVRPTTLLCATWAKLYNCHWPQPHHATHFAMLAERKTAVNLSTINSAKDLKERYERVFEARHY